VGTVVGTVGGLLVGAPTGPGALAIAGGGGALDGTVGYVAGTTLADPIANALRTPQEQQYFQAKMDFIAAVMRKESGANITAGEYRDADRRYFPQPGDGAHVIAQKAAARAQEIKTLEKESGDRPLLTPQPVALADKPGAARGPGMGAEASARLGRELAQRTPEQILSSTQVRDEAIAASNPAEVQRLLTPAQFNAYMLRRARLQPAAPRR